MSRNYITLATNGYDFNIFQHHLTSLIKLYIVVDMSSTYKKA